MKFYLPSWNGDFRLEDDGKGGSKLIVHKPTLHEQKILQEFLRQAKAKGWGGDRDPDARFGQDRSEVAISAPLSKASKVLIKLTRPKKQTLTAVSFSDGNLSVIEGADEEATEKIADAVEKAVATEDPKEPAKAASVKRPTPCCPVCEVGSVAPASEVLLSFLNEEEHESWARDRAIVVTGGLTGHRYVLAHRQSAIAAYNTKMCFDLDDGDILHFHDNSVPPEEEVLAAKLILEHREPWLRNEATCFGSTLKFKNPFGGGMDGTESADFAIRFGNAVASGKDPLSIPLSFNPLSFNPPFAPLVSARCDCCGASCDIIEDSVAQGPPGQHLCARCRETIWDANGVPRLPDGRPLQ